jgi:hypothetical protein
MKLMKRINTDEKSVKISAISGQEKSVKPACRQTGLCNSWQITLWLNCYTEMHREKRDSRRVAGWYSTLNSQLSSSQPLILWNTNETDSTDKHR